MVGAPLYMTSFINGFFKLIILGCFILGSFLIYTSRQEQQNFQQQNTNSKALSLKKYLIKFNKPQKVEIFNLTERLKKDVEEIKKINISLDPHSKFYISIDLFTDENDTSAPLIAQIKFFEVASDNKIKEENINLE